MKKINIMFAVIAMLLLGSNCWSACTTSQWTGEGSWNIAGANLIHSTCHGGLCKVYLPDVCNGIKNVPSNIIPARRANCYGYKSGFHGVSDIYVCPDNNYNHHVCIDPIDMNCANNTLDVYEIRCTQLCDTQTEADSVNCELKGNIWQGGTCKVNHCKAVDSTWLSTSIAACTGSNNYALVNTDSTCEHVGTCCPNDSIPSGNTCKWRCDSVLTACSNRTGDLFGAVLPDTSVSGQDTTFSYQCFYNCAHSPNPDSTVYIVEGNTILAGPSDSIADGIKSEWFSSIRSTTGSIYVYDYLSPTASEYVDSIAAMKCVEHLWRCVINNKYVYWYDNQEVPAGCTNIVRVK